ncbi:putative glucan endo-1,3-beta-glucosidase GVI [Amborella trichopoda]|nr:putative glucan endo-1,3-beta-glucosidase GVI [Amborella trichopoda]|eukprot:XP_006837422.2 putative glucan endo-1,3-beta-glucosidase GVI [Amborella trichopoda]
MELRVLPYVSFIAVMVAHAVDAHDFAKIGLNYGMKGDNLPPPSQVVALYEDHGIQKVRLFDPNPDALEALRGSGIGIHLGVLNEDIGSIATNSVVADQWVAAHVKPYVPDVNITYVSAGNEFVTDDTADQVPSAMQALRKALDADGLSNIKVTTTIATSVLSASYPPSQGAFTSSVTAAMTSIAALLTQQQAPLFVNVYPYFAHANDPDNVKLDYALFTALGPVVQDSGLSYQNLFDTILDAMYYALEKVGGASVELGVGETGWPSGGDAGAATIDNARTYTNNLIKHIASAQGTPKLPGKLIETYIFATFDEDLKPKGTEQNFGLFYPSREQVYAVDFFPSV